MLVAACAKGPDTVQQLLDYTIPYDGEFVKSVRNGLAQFDEHNLEGDTQEIDERIHSESNDELPPFRVYGEMTRKASSYPARTGLIIFNLSARRIVQVKNAYWEIERKDRGRIRRSGHPVKFLYHYSLPSEWSLVP